MSVITLDKLSKTYTIHEREAGTLAALRSLFKRKVRHVHAVREVSFDVAPGAIVGFLGPNGAGKTTTLKMLSGLLHPSGGVVRVLGHEPFQRQPAYLRQIALIMGQRNQLAWDIPAADSYELQRVIYQIPPAQFRETLAELVALLDLSDLIKKPVRNLSLGERMKCEIAGALLHRPRVIFMDEPTIGLDVTAQRRIRQFIAEYNRRHGATVLLTSHYMADVEALCERVIIIHEGSLLFDGPLADLVSRFSPHKTITVDLAEGRAESLAAYGELVAHTSAQATLRVPKADAAQVTGRLLADFNIADLNIQEPPIEEVIEEVFATGSRRDTPEAKAP